MLFFFTTLLRNYKMLERQVTFNIRMHIFILFFINILHFN